MCHRDVTLQVTGMLTKLGAPPGDPKRHQLSVWDGVHDCSRVFIDGSLHGALSLDGAGSWWLLKVSRLTFFPG